MTYDTWPGAVRVGRSITYSVGWINNTGAPQPVQFKAELYCYASAARSEPRARFDFGDDAWANHVIPPNGGTITKKIWVPSKCLPPNPLHIENGWFTGGGFLSQKVGGVEGSKAVNFNVVY